MGIGGIWLAGFILTFAGILIFTCLIDKDALLSFRGVLIISTFWPLVIVTIALLVLIILWDLVDFMTRKT
ncbi:hypothetical protein [Providencia manganoxydans]|uniref:hypothetical protein n=1 Tax=Providencia manganoxydans TaxID=2923283 RepID=UPI0034E47BD4